MAKKKSSRQGEINFIKVSVVLGMVVVYFLVRAFLDSAPSLSKKPFHEADASPQRCMACHVENIKDAPIMPHRPMDGCTFCHEPKGS